MRKAEISTCDDRGDPTRPLRQKLEDIRKVLAPERNGPLAYITSAPTLLNLTSRYLMQIFDTKTFVSAFVFLRPNSLSLQIKIS